MQRHVAPSQGGPRNGLRLSEKRETEFQPGRPIGGPLGKCDSEQAGAEEEKTGNGYSEETVRNEFFACHGTLLSLGNAGWHLQSTVPD